MYSVPSLRSSKPSTRPRRLVGRRVGASGYTRLPWSEGQPSHVLRHPEQEPGLSDVFRCVTHLPGTTGPEFVVKLGGLPLLLHGAVRRGSRKQNRALAFTIGPQLLQALARFPQPVVGFPKTLTNSSGWAPKRSCLVSLLSARWHIDPSSAQPRKLTGHRGRARLAACHART